MRDSRGHQHSGSSVRAQRTRTRLDLHHEKAADSRTVDSSRAMRGVERSVYTTLCSRTTASPTPEHTWISVLAVQA